MSPRRARALVGKTDAEMMAPWSLKRDGQKLFTMPKAAVWRSFVLNHLVHHRGQLSVYLRLNDVPVPVDVRAERRRSAEFLKIAAALASLFVFVVLATANGAGYRYGVLGSSRIRPGRHARREPRCVSA